MDAIKMWQISEMQQEQAEFEEIIFSQEMSGDVYVTLALDLDAFPL